MSEEWKARAQQIREQVNVPELVQLLGLEMDRSKICCPWHIEKTPSLHIYNDGAWCYGSCPQEDKAHSSIDLVMEIHGIELQEAIQWIESQFGLGSAPIALVHESHGEEHDKELWAICEKEIVSIVKPFLLQVSDELYPLIRDEAWKSYAVWDRLAKRGKEIGESPTKTLERTAGPIQDWLKEKLKKAIKERKNG